jgi:hypothetical protein
MIIPSKFNGFHDGVRRCFGGGGGGGGGGDASSAANGGDGIGGMGTGVGDGPGPGPGSGPGAPGGDGTNSDYTSTTNRNTGNTGNTTFNPNRGSITGMNFTGTGNTYGNSPISLDNPARRAMGGVPYNQSGQYYNSLLQQGYTGNDIRNSLTTQGRPVSDSDYGFLVQNAAMTSPTSRPFAGSDQFFQPVYNTSYQNYARPSTQFDVSTYGTQPMNSPAFNSGMSRGNINNTIENFYQTNPMGRNADISSTLDFMRDSGVNREDFQSWAGKNNYGPQMSMPQMQSPFNPYTNSSGYGGYMPQMQTPFSYQQQSYQPSYQPSYQQQSYQPSYQPQYNPYQMQSPFSYQQPAPMPQRTSSGPSQAIVGRSSQMRGTPNVMRRAEGGIASLMDDIE